MSYLSSAPFIFPSDFKFGIADADLQVIGEDNTVKYEKSEPTMWNNFSKTSGKCYQNQTPGKGIDRFHKWKEDIEIMKRLGIHHYRTSVSMSRILNNNGTINSKAIEWYTKYFKSLKKSGIKIYATLYHWELPQKIYEQGGWKNKKTIDFFTRHAETVVNFLGEYIDEYFIINEPWCISQLSYNWGTHAPGHNSLKEALEVAHNILLAIGVTFDTMKKIKPSLIIGTVFNSEPSYAYSMDEKDLLAAKYHDGFFNRWFMDPIYYGKYPKYMVELYDKAMPDFKKADMDTIKIGEKLDIFGLNNYCGKILKYNDRKQLKFEEIKIKGGPENDLGWPIFFPPHYPDELYDILLQVYLSYKEFGLKKIYVTENGVALKSRWNRKNDIIDDERRIAYYKEHIKQTGNAIKRGIPVEGYFAWTFMDNYEWTEGYRPEACFGLIHVDRKTMKRIPKKSAYWYKELISTHAVT